MANTELNFKVKNGIDIGASNGTAPISTSSTTLVTNLNADLLDGNHASAFSPVAGSSSITTTGTVTTGTWSGLFGSVSGVNLTSLNASNLSSGTVPDARISGTYTGMTNLTGSGTAYFSKFHGNGGDTATTPSFSWTNDTTTGMYRSNASEVSIATGGVQRFKIDSTGDTSIIGGALTLLGAVSGSPVSAAGKSLYCSARTFTDTISITDAVVPYSVGTSFQQPTFASTNVTTITHAANVYVANSPLDGTNVTSTNKHALHVGNGRTFMAAAGLASIPTLAIRDVNTGLYSSATGTLNVATAGTLAATFGSTGTLTTEGIITAPGITLAASGSGIQFSNQNALPSTDATTLDYYEEGTFTGTLTGCTTSPTLTISYVRVGKLVTLSFPATSATSNATSCTITSTEPAIRPTAARAILMRTTDSSVTGIGNATIGTTGTFTLYKDGANTLFTATGTKGVATCSVSYII